MIENIFVPTHLGSYYLFKKRMVGIDIGKTHINATAIQLKGNAITVENFYSVAIESTAHANPHEHTIQALKKLIESLPQYDQLHTCLSSSLIVFKELKLPFTDREKIALIIKFEIEPLLPFSVNDAIIDFIITKTIPEEKSSHILVACVQKQHMVQHINLFEKAGVEPDLITVDFFALYGLYHAIPAYNQESSDVIVVDLGFNSTRMAYLQNGQLRFIRLVSQGISSLTKQVATALNISPAQAYENIVRFGLLSDNANDNAKISDIFKTFLEKIAFTLSSFANQTEHESIKKIILIGNASQTKGFEKLAEDILHIPTTLFDLNLITQIPHVHLKNNLVPMENLLSFAIAIPWPLLSNFNLRKEEFFARNTTILLKQLIVMAVLIVSILAMLCGHYILQTRKLNRELIASQKEAVTLLKEQFTKIPQDENDLDDIVELAREQVEKEKETWFAFSYANQARYLQYLLELTNKIDKNRLGFEINKITIAEGTIILKAQVRDYEALKILERELRTSSLFEFVEPQDNPVFTMYITLAPTIEEL